MRRWTIWKDSKGFERLCWARDRPPDDEPTWTLVREFESENWLTARAEVKGAKADIDFGMRRLVKVLNELPGVMTVSCCQGHPSQDDTHAYVELHVDDMQALMRLLELLQFANEGDTPYWLNISLNWRRGVMGNQMELPPGALALTLTWHCLDGSGDRVPPRPDLMNEFTRALRERGVKLGLLPPGRPIDNARAACRIHARRALRPQTEAQRKAALRASHSRGCRAPIEED